MFKVFLGSLLLALPLSAKEAVKSELVATQNGPVRELSSSDFNPTLQKNRFVIVDVYSQRCGACKQLEPVYEKLNRDYGDKYVFAKLNAPKYASVSNSLRVQAYPTIIFFKDGKEVARTVGFTSGDDLIRTAQANFKD